MKETILGEGKFLSLVHSEHPSGMSREWVKSKDSIAALVVNYNEDQVLLLRQMRIPILPDSMYAPVGGYIEDDESPDITSIREIEEETGLSLDDDIFDIIDEMGPFYVSAGLTNEKVYLHVVETDTNLNDLLSRQTDPEEGITLRIVSIHEFMEMNLKDWRLEILRSML